MRSRGPRGGRAKRGGDSSLTASATTGRAIVFNDADLDRVEVGRLAEATLPPAILRQLGAAIAVDHRFHITLEDGRRVVFGVRALQRKPDGSALTFLRIYEVAAPGTSLTQLFPNDWSVWSGEPDLDGIFFHPMDMGRDIYMGDLIEVSAPGADRPHFEAKLASGDTMEMGTVTGKVALYRVCSVMVKPDNRIYAILRLVAGHQRPSFGIA